MDTYAVFKDRGVQYRLKRVSIGRKIYVDKDSDYSIWCKKKLKDSGLEYFSHPFGNKPFFKVQVKPSEITSFLKTKYNVNAVKIDMLHHLNIK